MANESSKPCRGGHWTAKETSQLLKGLTYYKGQTRWNKISREFLESARTNTQCKDKFINLFKKHHLARTRDYQYHLIKDAQSAKANGLVLIRDYYSRENPPEENSRPKKDWETATGCMESLPSGQTPPPQPSRRSSVEPDSKVDGERRPDLADPPALEQNTPRRPLPSIQDLPEPETPATRPAIDLPGVHNRKQSSSSSQSPPTATRHAVPIIVELPVNEQVWRTRIEYGDRAHLSGGDPGSRKRAPILIVSPGASSGDEADESSPVSDRFVKRKLPRRLTLRDEQRSPVVRVTEHSVLTPEQTSPPEQSSPPEQTSPPEQSSPPDNFVNDPELVVNIPSEESEPKAREKHVRLSSDLYDRQPSGPSSSTS